MMWLVVRWNKAARRPAWPAVVATFAAGFLSPGPTALAQAPGADRGQLGPHAVRLEPSVRIPMRDGALLSTDLYFPEGLTGRLPVILMRTPYNKRPHQRAGSEARWFTTHGYVVAVQDKRGKFESEGRYTISAADREDGYDSVDWLARQPWSNGRIGTYGCSYLGENQIQLAATRHPNHAAAIAKAAGGIMRYAGVLNGGAVELAAAVGWFSRNGSKVHFQATPGTPDSLFVRAAPFFNLAPRIENFDFRAAWNTLPLIESLRRAGTPPSDFDEFVSHPPGDPWWGGFGYITERDRFDVPTLHVNSWYDYGVAETLALFNLFRTNAESARGRDHQFAIISPTAHCASEGATKRTVVGTREVGDARLDYSRIYLDWFDYWLKGAANDVVGRPRLALYLMGRNEWRQHAEWPLRNTRFERWYLHSGGRANSLHGDGRLSPAAPGRQPPDRFVYDPRNPVPSLGGPVCCTGTPDAPAGAFDQTPVEIRQDVLVYTSEPLATGVELTGPIEAVLYVSSDAPDTDFTVKLVDVYPDGTAYNVQEGILRARYRNGFDRPTRMRPGEIYEVRVNVHATSNYFGPGHRIRVEVSSSNFPRFDRNLNTGGNNFDESRPAIATNTIHHSSTHPSHIVLPVIP